MNITTTDQTRTIAAKPKRVLLTSLFVLLTCSCMNIVTEAQPSVQLYPKVVRVKKGKTKTLSAAAFNGPNQPVFSATFTFTNTNASVASLSNALTVGGDNIAAAGTPPPNLRTISGLAAGTTTVTARWNNTNSQPITIIVDDPAAAPTAVIHGDNDASGGSVINARVGEAIEVDADESRGVHKIEWSWGDGDKTTELLSGTHAYLVAGTYPITLKVTNLSGQIATTTVNVNVSAHPAPTRTINVTTIQQLLNAYNGATGGEHIVIPAGTVLTGEIVLPARNFSDYVTIRSSATMPDLRDRVAPNQAGLVTFRGSYEGSNPFIIRKGASKIRLAGIKFDPKYIPQATGIASYYLAQIGEALTQNSSSENPSKIIIQHCVINPPDDVQVVHGILNDGYKVSIISSWLGNIKTFSNDSQAIISFDGRGAHVYHNNYLEAATENVMYGGTVPRIVGIVPTNIEFRRTHFFKRLSWRNLSVGGYPVFVKNLFETKNARRVYLESSVFENHWDAGVGQKFALVFKSAASPGSTGEFVPWAVSEDIVVENSKLLKIHGGLTTGIDVYDLAPFLGLKPNNIFVKNTLFDDISYRWGTPGATYGARFIQPNNVEDLVFDKMTMIDKDGTSGGAAFYATNNNFRFSIMNSIFTLGQEGIGGSGVGDGMRALNPGSDGLASNCTRPANASWSLYNNVIPRAGHNISCYPSQSPQVNQYPTNYGAIGFVNLAGGDYRLAASSPYKGTASDGGDPGVDVQVLNQRIGCSVSGSSGSCLGTVVVPSTVSISGRILLPSGQGSARTKVQIADTSGRIRVGFTNPFGYYRFFNLSTGNYVFTIMGKNRPVSVFNRSLVQDSSAVDFTYGN